MSACLTLSRTSQFEMICKLQICIANIKLHKFPESLAHLAQKPDPYFPTEVESGKKEGTAFQWLFLPGQIKLLHTLWLSVGNSQGSSLFIVKNTIKGNNCYKCFLDNNNINSLGGMGSACKWYLQIE